MSKQIRIGGPVFAPVDTPEQFVRHLREQGFAATYHPRFADPVLLREAVAALAEADIVIAETGAFGINVLDPDAEQRERNIAEICRRLESADSIGSLCCVAHGGWVGGNSFNKHHPENFSARSVDNLVAAVQRIIDTVQPRRRSSCWRPSRATCPTPRTCTWRSCRRWTGRHSAPTWTRSTSPPARAVSTAAATSSATVSPSSVRTW